MRHFREVLLSCVALGGLALPAIAEDGSVTVIGRAAPGLVTPMQRAHAGHELIQISTMNRHVVGIVMQDDAVAPELIQLQMGNQPIYVDPDRDYARTTGGIDEGHSIIRAQRAYKALTAQDTAYVIRRDLTQVEEKQQIMPRAILLRPDHMQRRAPQAPQAPAPIHRTPKAEKRPMALAK